MLDFEAKIEMFKEHLAITGRIYNDAASYGVEIESLENPLWRVLGVYHLTPDENRGNHNVFIEMLCQQGDREGFRAIHWTWQGRGPEESAPDIFAGQKPLHELVDLPLNLGMIVSVWTNGGEVAVGFSSNHPDENVGNTIGHHSFFVCFQEIGDDDPDPGPDPIPDPDPEPEPEPPKTETETASMLINKAWFDSLTADEDGYVRIRTD